MFKSLKILMILTLLPMPGCGTDDLPYEILESDRDQCAADSNKPLIDGLAVTNKKDSKASGSDDKKYRDKNNSAKKNGADQGCPAEFEGETAKDYKLQN